MTLPEDFDPLGWLFNWKPEPTSPMGQTVLVRDGDLIFYAVRMGRIWLARIKGVTTPIDTPEHWTIIDRDAWRGRDLAAPA